jgi:precorrin-6B methylase 2
MLKKAHWHWVYLWSSCSTRFSELYYDNKFNIRTSGKVFNTDESDKSHFQDETEYMPSSYPDLKRVLTHLNLQPDDVFVDIGCGKARAVFLASTYHIKKATGIELRKPVFDEALKNSQTIRFKKSEISLFHGDATKFNWDEMTVFYFFNPFGINTFRQVIESIHESVKKKPRQIKLVYYAAFSGTVECHAYLNSLNWVKPSPGLTGTRIPVQFYSNY